MRLFGRTERKRRGGERGEISTESNAAVNDMATL